MTNLRQGRWLRTGLLVRSAQRCTATVLLAAGLLTPAAQAATPHAHARRPLPTALHTSTVAETAPRRDAKRRKGKGNLGAHAAGAQAAPAAAGARHPSKKKGRSRRAEPADDPIPMFRAQRRPGPTHPDRALAAARTSPRRGSRRELLAYGPAPLVASSGHGRHGAARPEAAFSAPDRSPHRTALSASRAGEPSHPAPPSSPSREEDHAGQSGTAFAEGVSRPDDDERLPQIHAALTEAGEPAVAASEPAPIAHISAGSPYPSSAPAPSSVVQGFGGEIAVPSAAAADRPGGTRRRNHPPNWTPESLVTQPEPLEEREAITEAAVSPAVLPEIYDRNGRLLMPAPLRGSHDVLVHQNVMAANDGLERIQDDADLDRMRLAHRLVGFPVSESLRLNEDLPSNRRYARPWTVAFAADTARAFYGRFRQPLQVNSAVRTVHYQARLQMVNGNAAATYGDAASPHLTGQAIDLGKRGMSQAQLAWMRDYLLPLMRAGKIDVEEEFQQACFHISVYRSYAAGRHALQHEVAQAHPAVQTGAGDAPQD